MIFEQDQFLLFIPLTSQAGRETFVEDFPACHRMFNNILGLYPLDASRCQKNLLPQVLTTKTASRYCRTFPGAKHISDEHKHILDEQSKIHVDFCLAFYTCQIHVTFIMIVNRQGRQSSPTL